MIKFDFNTYMKNISEEINYDKLENKLLNDKLNDWYTKEESTDNIKILAQNIRNNFDVFIVIGIGGSILGSKGIIEALTPYIKKDTIEIIYIGNSLSSEYIAEIIDYIKDKRTFVNVISKSGNTLEPLLTLEIIYPYIKKEDIIITTEETGSLCEFAKKENIKTLPFPKVGGRFSFLKLPGLLPMAVAGLNIDKILEGSYEAKKNTNAIKKYVTIRNHFYNSNKSIEIFNVYEPKLKGFLECIEQIFAETEGKENKGLLPVLVVNTNKLHSLGQYIQEGKNILFETTILIEKTKKLIVNKYDKELNAINNSVAKSVAEAHCLNQRYTNMIKMDELNEYNIGYLSMFFMIASVFGSYLLDVEYYNQPGVEKYKNILSQNL